MTTVTDIQKRLKSMGFDPGPLDGLVGPKTLGAMSDALDALEACQGGSTAPGMPIQTIPTEWMPWAQMERVIFHWTAGSNHASATDREHYHFMIEGDGKLVRGDNSVLENQAPISGNYAAHTKNCNTGSIGISLCGMAEATEKPFNAGHYPITETQWKTLAKAIADLCERYAIPVTRSTVLSHAEVQPTLGIAQSGKWDIARLPWDASVQGPIPVGDQMRAMVVS